MVRKVSAMAVRDRLGQLLEEVYYKGDAVIIERAGRPMAVLVPPAEYERLRASRAKRFQVYERIKARTKRIPGAKLDRAIEEGMRAARGGR
ncbi:MAG: type II toxin-antitoxin system Phd/YefM family antitoxin [Candidatus Rokubacteria bacterium]|nr:type II toxin-antitoxin system Phd/YefM family antitoxin [Candidatus Rokubacteria bacterium]